MSCAALSISAVRMAERGMDTRSETDDIEGLSLSAAVEDKGQSSWHRDTMESTITCSGHTGHVLVFYGLSVKGFHYVMYLQLLVCSFGQFPSQRVQSLPHRPVH